MSPTIHDRAIPFFTSCSIMMLPHMSTCFTHLSTHQGNQTKANQPRQKWRTGTFTPIHPNIEHQRKKKKKKTLCSWATSSARLMMPSKSWQRPSKTNNCISPCLPSITVHLGTNPKNPRTQNHHMPIYLAFLVDEVLHVCRASEFDKAEVVFPPKIPRNAWTKQFIFKTT